LSTILAGCLGSVPEDDEEARLREGRGIRLGGDHFELNAGAGTVAGGVISASVASVFTFAMGQAWLTVCQKSSGGALPSLGGVADSKALHDLFMSEFKRRIPGVRQGP
jgi:hypothetical protein